MFPRAILSTLCLLLVLSANGLATEALRVELSISQADSSGDEVMLWSDQYDLVKDREATGYMVGLSFDLKYLGSDSDRVSFNVHAVTHAEKPANRARKFTGPLGIPAALRDLKGKLDQNYTLTVLPKELVEVDSAACPYSQHTVEDFRVDPTAHFDIYYVENSHGDFYWNSVKGLLEQEFERLDKLMHFTLPGKYLLYLCPCDLNTVIWDTRFATMVDPVRSTMYGVYTKEFNSVYPFIVSYAAILRNRGYAPPFISEGLANYLSFALHDLKKLKADKQLIPLDSLLSTAGYYRADPVLADRMSAGFVKFLVGKYNVPRFMQWYKSSHDLNYRDNLERIFATTIDQLETEYLNFIDTATVSFDETSYFQQQAETMLNYDLMHQYAEEMLKQATTPKQIAESLRRLVRSSFFVGDYEAAASYQRRLLKTENETGAEWMSLASYSMMKGDYKEAGELLDNARQMDTANNLITFNTGVNYLAQHDTVDAIASFEKVIKHNSTSWGLIESWSLLGSLLAGQKDAALAARGKNYLRQAVDLLSREASRHNPSASRLMWMGIAFLGLEDNGGAYDALSLAQYLETRTFYQGMIELWLGKLADRRGDRDLAIGHYRKVIDGPYAQFHRDEAKQLIEHRYQ